MADAERWTVHRAAARLRVTTRTVRTYCSTGVLEAERGERGAFLIAAASVERLAEARAFTTGSLAAALRLHRDTVAAMLDDGRLRRCERTAGGGARRGRAFIPRASVARLFGADVIALGALLAERPPQNDTDTEAARHRAA